VHVVDQNREAGTITGGYGFTWGSGIMRLGQSLPTLPENLFWTSNNAAQIRTLFSTA
jgi:hypothetical protein